MNPRRLIVLGLALVAALSAAFLVRALIGGGTPSAQARPEPIAMSEVLVASINLRPGQALKPDEVHWQRWPTSSVDSTFISHAAVTSEADAVRGTVVRTPILAGQPIVSSALVHAAAGGFMAAMLTPGMRAVSITISPDSSAGGFILPNDRIDVILTRKSGTEQSRATSRTLLTNVRVLAVDQTYSEDKNTKTVIGKTATVEVTPAQAEILSAAEGSGTLSLALRPLTDDAAKNGPLVQTMAGNGGSVAVIRYGLLGLGDIAGRSQ